MASWIEPEWPAPPSIRAISTLRAGGVSAGPYFSLNLGDHVGDDPASVSRNRSILQREIGLPNEPVWLKQVHGTRVIDAAIPIAGDSDASYSNLPGVVCAVLTADCLPILLCSPNGDRWAAAHAGWRGLAAGIIETVVATLGGPLIAWLGPAIGPEAFEVGDDVRDAFMKDDPSTGPCFKAHHDTRWLADLYGLARVKLAGNGITAVYGGNLCTYSDPVRFFSYRREGITGRMATMIWGTP